MRSKPVTNYVGEITMVRIKENSDSWAMIPVRLMIKLTYDPFKSVLKYVALFSRRRVVQQNKFKPRSGFDAHERVARNWRMILFPRTMQNFFLLTAFLKENFSIGITSSNTQSFWKCNLPISCLPIAWSVCHNFLKG